MNRVYLFFLLCSFATKGLFGQVNLWGDSVATVEGGNFVFQYKADFYLTGVNSKVTYKKIANTNKLIRLNDTVGYIDKENPHTARHYLKQYEFSIFTKTTVNVEYRPRSPIRMQSVAFFFSLPELYSITIGFHPDTSMSFLNISSDDSLLRTIQNYVSLPLNEGTNALGEHNSFTVGNILFGVMLNDHGKLSGVLVKNNKDLIGIMVHLTEGYQVKSVERYELNKGTKEVINYDCQYYYYRILSREYYIEKDKEFIKSGEWRYFDKDEKLIKKEYWKNNILTKTEIVK